MSNWENDFPFVGNLILGCEAVAHFCHHLSVHLHQPLFNDFVCFAAGSHTTMRQVFVQAHGIGGKQGLLRLNRFPFFSRRFTALPCFLGFYLFLVIGVLALAIAALFFGLVFPFRFALFPVFLAESDGPFEALLLTLLIAVLLRFRSRFRLFLPGCCFLHVVDFGRHPDARYGPLM